MYVLWWHKPFDVEHRTIVPFVFPEGFDPQNCEGQPSSPEARWTYHVPEVDWKSMLAFLGVKAGFSDYSVVTYGTATIFSALHVVAWNWTFPTPFARVLWRVCSIVAAGAPMVSLYSSMVYGFVQPKDLEKYPWRGTFGARVTFCFVIFGICIYVICRLVILALIFYSFCSMPVSVYETVNWTRYFPHFS